MITGNDLLQIKSYLPIDRLAEGYVKIYPNEGERFLGWPYGYADQYSSPFIEIRKNGKTVKTVNCADISEIEFY